jgi:hypothetical protein
VSERGEGSVESHCQKHRHDSGSTSWWSASPNNLSGRSYTSTGEARRPLASLPGLLRASYDRTSVRDRVPFSDHIMHDTSRLSDRYLKFQERRP